MRKLITVCIYMIIQGWCTFTSWGQCNDSVSMGRSNLGLYGGTSLDISYSAGGRLFAAVLAPTSLYYSDDTATTWHHAFPNDSLLFDCNRGWGGKGLQVLSNTKGWVAARTSIGLDEVTASIISFSEGDSGSWKTAMDPYLLIQAGYSFNKLSNIGLSDYFLYTALGNIITITDTTALDPANDIIKITTLIPGIPDTTSIMSIAAANNTTGFPFYIVADTSGVGVGMSVGRLLYKFNGVSFSLISLPSDISSLTKVFTHPFNPLGDTLFVTGTNSLNQYLVYRSYDGGANWIDITFYTGIYGTYELTDVDYSSVWKLSSPAGDGIILNCKGVYISKDLGSTWETIEMPSAGLSVHPNNIDVIAKSYDRVIQVSNTGSVGPFILKNNEGLEAAFIYKIARTQNKGIFYLATNSGLAYTTAYTDTTISAFQKWQFPYGEFPLSSLVLSSGEVLKTVAINPYDSLNVITGSKNGFYVSQVGSTGFGGCIVPSGWDNMQVNDIEFINSKLVIAVTGGDVFNAFGNIWRSEDKGSTWSFVSPYNFTCGNTVAVGYGKNDTVIYVGTGIAGKKVGVLWKSNDLGVSWAAVNAGPNDFSNLTTDSLPIVDIEVDPRGTDTLYIVGVGWEGKSSMARSSDGGSSYQYINAFISTSDMPSAVAIHQQYPDSVYLAVGENIGVYDAIADSVSYFFSGFPGEIIHDICYGSILVGTTTGFYGFGLSETNDIAVGLSSASVNKNEIIIYPNPVLDGFYIHTDKQYPMPIRIEIYDLIGNLLEYKAQGKMEASIDMYYSMSAYSSGIYIAKIISGNSVFSARLFLMH